MDGLGAEEEGGVCVCVQFNPIPKKSKTQSQAKGRVSEATAVQHCRQNAVCTGVGALVRVALAAVGRGGGGEVGQRIRDEILAIQQRNGCKVGRRRRWGGGGENVLRGVWCVGGVLAMGCGGWTGGGMVVAVAVAVGGSWLNVGVGVCVWGNFTPAPGHFHLDTHQY